MRRHDMAARDDGDGGTIASLRRMLLEGALVVLPIGASERTRKEESPA